MATIPRERDAISEIVEPHKKSKENTNVRINIAIGATALMGPCSNI